MEFLTLRLLLLMNLVVAVLFLFYSVFLTDACWTVPCLSSDFNVNVMRVSVSASVSAVIYGVLVVLTPLAGLYMLWHRVKSFSGGVLNGIVIIISLLSWLQCITWGEQFANLRELTINDILMYGSIYQINTKLRRDAMIMSIMCGVLAILFSFLSLALLRLREFYCVDIYNNGGGYRTSRNVLRTFQQYHTVAVSGDDPSETLGSVDDDEAIMSTSIPND